MWVVERHLEMAEPTKKWFGFVILGLKELEVVVLKQINLPT